MQLDLKGLKGNIDFLNEIYENVTSAIFLADYDARIYHFNDAFKTLFYKPEDRLLSQLCGEAMGCIFHLEENTHCGQTSVCCDCLLRHNIVKSMLEKIPIFKAPLERKFQIREVFIEKHFIFTTKYIHYNGIEMVLVIFDDITDLENQKRIIASQKKELLEINHDLHTRNENLTGLLIRSLEDIRRTGTSLQQQKTTTKTLQREVQHRVGNSLAVIAALLQLQKEELNAVNFMEKIEETENRIRVINKLHQHLYTPDYDSSIQPTTYLKALLTEFEGMYHIRTTRVQMQTSREITAFTVPQALSAGLILNEFFLQIKKSAQPEETRIVLSLQPGNPPTSCRIVIEGCPLKLSAVSCRQFIEFISLFVHPRDGSLNCTSDRQSLSCRIDL